MPQRTRQRTTDFFVTLTGDESAEMVDSHGNGFKGSGLDAGVFVDLGTSTGVDIDIVDSRGYSIYSANAISADTSVAPTAAGVVGALTATSANNSDGAHTVTVHIVVRQ